MNLRTSISILLQIAGRELSPQSQSELVVYQEATNWVDIAFFTIFLAIAIPSLIWAILRMKTTMSQQSIAIDSNSESIRVTKEAIEVSRETNRLLAALNDELRRKTDSEQEKE